MGRPSVYTPEIADEICRRLASGESLRGICETKGLPSRETVRKWLATDEGFLGQYARAREEQAEHYADEIIEIADTAEDHNKARLQIDARKWKTARLAPKKWGDRVTSEVTGSVNAEITLKYFGPNPD